MRIRWHQGVVAALLSVLAWVSPSLAASPLSGVKLYVDPISPAAKQVVAWQADRPADAAQIQKIASQPQAIWLSGKTPSITEAVGKINGALAASQNAPIFVLYTIPQRDCGGLAAGGFGSAESYRAWVRAVAEAIGSRQAIAIVEPDALANAGCLSQSDQQVRFDLIKYAVESLQQLPAVSTYIDSGNPAWKPAQMMIDRLKKAGIEKADGFSLNVSIFETTESNIRYGTTISEQVGGKHFIIDTGRNGLGPTVDHQWCNPPGRALGTPPTFNTDNSLVDALLWIKQPGFSDGYCRDSAVGYGWWADYALGLAQRANFSVPSPTPAPAPPPAPAPTSSPTPVPSSGFQASLMSQNTRTPYLTRGASYNFQVTFRNTGSTTWSRSNLQLGTDGPQDRKPIFSRGDVVKNYPSGWASDTRVQMKETSVAPGQTGTFKFWYSVPQVMALGLYTEGFRLVSNGTNWLSGADVSWTIKVR